MRFVHPIGCFRGLSSNEHSCPTRICLAEMAMHSSTLCLKSRYTVQLPLNSFVLPISFISREKRWTYETHISPSRQNFIHSSQPNRRTTPSALSNMRRRTLTLNRNTILSYLSHSNLDGICRYSPVSFRRPYRLAYPQTSSRGLLGSRQCSGLLSLFLGGLLPLNSQIWLNNEGGDIPYNL